MREPGNYPPARTRRRLLSFAVGLAAGCILIAATSPLALASSTYTVGICESANVNNFFGGNGQSAGGFSYYYASAPDTCGNPEDPSGFLSEEESAFTSYTKTNNNVTAMFPPWTTLDGLYVAAAEGDDTDTISATVGPFGTNVYPSSMTEIDPDFGVSAGSLSTGTGTAGWQAYSDGSWSNPQVNGDCNQTSSATVKTLCEEGDMVGPTAGHSSNTITLPNDTSRLELQAQNSSSTNGLNAAAVGSLKLTYLDPDSEPALSASGSITTNSGWISGTSNNSTQSITYTASDDAGVCFLEAELLPSGSTTPAETQVDGAASAPAQNSDGSFVSPTCTLGDVQDTWSFNTASLSNGQYTVEILGENPSNYQADTREVIGSYPLNIDSSTPAVQISGESAGWTSTSQTIAVSGSDSGGSGISTMSCTDGGTGMAPASSALLDGTLTQNYTISGTASHSVACTATNGADTSGRATAMVDIDGTAPGISYSGATFNQWTSSAQTVTVTVTSGPSGITNSNSASCSIDGGTSVSKTITDGSFTLPVPATDTGSNTIACSATSGAGLTTDSTSRPVEIDDQTPTVAFTGLPGSATSASAADWDGEGGTLTATASEPVTASGIASAACSVNGDQYETVQSSSMQIPLNTSGQYQIDCYATTNTGVSNNKNPLVYYVNIDTSQPVVTITDSNATNAAGWYSSNQTLQVGATDPGSSGVKAGSLLCTDSVGNGGNISPANGQINIDGDGKHSVTCSATTNAGNTGSVTKTFDVDTETPTVVISGPSSTAWEANTANLTVTGADTGPSGITAISCSTDGGSSSPLALTGNAGPYAVGGTTGSHTASCVATDAAGVSSQPSTYTVQIQNTGDYGGPSASTVYGSSPAIDSGNDPYSDGPSQTTWYTTSQQVVVTATHNSGAPIASIQCSGATTASFVNGSGTPTDSATVTVNAPGGELDCVAIDASGTTYALGYYKFKIDDTPPVGVFYGPDPNSPALVQVAAADSGSGVAGVSVAYTCVSGDCLTTDEGEAFPEQTQTATLNSGGFWEATIPDTGTWPDGQYTMSAVISDVAGNTTTTTTFANGDGASMSLPARVVTEVAATVTGGGQTADSQTASAVTGVATQTTTAGDGNPGTVLGDSIARHGSIVHRTITPAKDQAAASQQVCFVKVIAVGKASGAQNAPTKLTRNCQPLQPLARNNKKVGTTLTVKYGTRAHVSGRLVAPSSGEPIAAALITVEEDVSAAGKTLTLGRVTTNSKGQFSYTLPPGPSRKLIFLYDGTPVLRTSASTVTERFRGLVTIHIPATIRAGKSFYLTGRVYGAYLPVGGILVTPRYKGVGIQSGWASLGTQIRTNNQGDFRIKMTLPTVTRHITYDFDVAVNDQTGYAYLTATSKTFKRTVQ